MSNILWLASYPKSGNTWVRAYLANLVANQAAPLSLAQLSGYCDDEARPDLYSEIAGRPSTELDITELCALRSEVHARIATSRAGTVFVKTHNMAGSFDGYPLHNMALTAGAIYVVRNPLDVAVSMTHHFGLTLDEAIQRLAAEQVATLNDAMFVSQYLGSWSRHVQSWSNNDNAKILTVRYEDLLEKPVKWFGKIARLVGLDRDRGRVERAIQHASFKTLSGIERRDGFVETSSKTERFFRVGSANQWRDVLSREQVNRIIGDHREQMKRFGYLPAGY